MSYQWFVDNLDEQELDFLEQNSLSVEAVIDALKGYIKDANPRPENDENSEHMIDIRLQVHKGWSLHSGDSSFDQDHCGYWGSTSYDAESDAEVLAMELIDQVLEQWASDDWVNDYTE